MNSFKDHLRYQKFCEEISDNQRKKEEQETHIKKELQKDENLQDYLRVVSVDIAEQKKRGVE